MEREIKFRAWDKQKKEWLNPALFAVLGSGFGMHYNGMWRSLNLDDYEITQFTGLTDKNEKEIFEGDLVKTVTEHPCTLSSDWAEYTKGEITWLNEGFKVCQEYVGANDLSVYEICDCCPCGLEIIGNIYEK